MLRRPTTARQSRHFIARRGLLRTVHTFGAPNNSDVAIGTSARAGKFTVKREGEDLGHMLDLKVREKDWGTRYRQGFGVLKMSERNTGSRVKQVAEGLL